MPDGFKPTPNRRLYMDALRKMTPEQRLAKAFELTAMSREALRAGIEQRYPDSSEQQRHEIYLERLGRCRSRNS